MAIKDFYIVLGISRTETPAGIRGAFRELAKTYHPDRVGPQATQKFQEIAEAYETLSDPQKRQQYNDTLRDTETTSVTRRAEPLSPGRRKPAEPLVSKPLSVLHDFHAIAPSFDALFDRMLRNFTAIAVPKGERIEGLNIEVILSPLEAARGAAVPIGVPIFDACSLCRGSGTDWLLPCMACAGRGRIERQVTVFVPIPPMVRDRTVIEVPVDGLGMRNFFLRLHIRISS
jgi:DnaJ-class molecular chaperone